jgi:hypothetical protein
MDDEIIFDPSDAKGLQKINKDRNRRMSLEHERLT